MHCYIAKFYCYCNFQTDCVDKQAWASLPGRQVLPDSHPRQAWDVLHDNQWLVPSHLSYYLIDHLQTSSKCTTTLCNQPSKGGFLSRRPLHWMTLHCVWFFNMITRQVWFMLINCLFVGGAAYHVMSGFGHQTIANGAQIKLAEVLFTEYKDKPVRINEVRLYFLHTQYTCTQVQYSVSVNQVQCTTYMYNFAWRQKISMVILLNCLNAQFRN